MEKWFEKTMQDVMAHNDYNETMTTVKECDKQNMWTPIDLIIREYLNNGGGSAKGFLGISPDRCIRAYQYACTIKPYLIENDLINKEGFNNHGFKLWSNYEF